MKTTVDGMTILGTPLIDGFVFGPKGGAVGTTQLPFLAQSVIDSAVMVWMQMGLTNDQIKYALAATNVESGFFPDSANGVPTDTIRGLGQVTNGAWVQVATKIDFDFNFASDDNAHITTTPVDVNNVAGFHVFNGNPNGTNAQSGEANDPAVGGAGIYDPQGLVKQLEVDGELAIREWRNVGPTELKVALDFDKASPAFQSVCPVAVDSNGAPLPVASQSPNTVDIASHQREKLERLCRYVSRPPVASERLALTASGQVRYTLKTPYRDGTTHIVLEPLDLMARLAALVPKPRMHLTRYHGVFAPHSQYRSAVTPAQRGRGALRPPASDADPAKVSTPRHVAMSWARRLKRVFGVEIEGCVRCGGELKIIASIEEPQLIAKILSHLERAAPEQYQSELPLGARGPPAQSSLL